MNCDFGFGGEMDVVTLHFLEAVLADGVEESRGGAVIKNFGRLLRRVLKIDFNRVALAGANALAVVA